jgi:hypothetical protein
MAAVPVEGKYRFARGSSRAEVTARAPGHSFRCAGSGIEGEVSIEGGRIVSGSASFPLEKLEAGDPFGNHELKKFLRVDQKPEVKGELETPIALTISGDRVSGEGKVRLSVQGPTATVPIRFEGSLPRVKATIEVTFTGLGYQPPKLLFLKVKDDLKVELDLRVEAP